MQNARWAFLKPNLYTSINAELKNQLISALKLSKEGHRDASHQIVQDYNEPTSCWMHALLHKIEGDEDNSRYWYARCDVSFEDYTDVSQELDAIEVFLI